MSYEARLAEFEKERINVVEIDVPRCVNTYNTSPCTAEQYLFYLTVTSGEFRLGDIVSGDITGYEIIIERISRSGDLLVVSGSLRVPGDIPDNTDTVMTNQSRTGTATRDAVNPSLDKCYNTRATCQDLANFDDTYSVTNTDVGTINIVTSNLKGLYASSGWGLTNFQNGDIVTVTGFSNEENNRDYILTDIDGNDMDFRDVFDCVSEIAASGITVSTKVYYTYRFVTPRSPHPLNMNNYYPCVDSISIAPSTVKAKSGISARNSATITMLDFPASDRNDVDPYLSDRDFTPFDLSLFWVKWRTRNAFYENYPVRIKTGYLIDGIFNENNFQTRYFTMTGFNLSGGQASITCKDPLTNITNKKAVAPAASTGVLNAGINASDPSLTLTPSGVGNSEYPSTASGSFWVKIGSEILECTSRSGDTLTVSRGQYNTTATAHSANDVVQLCLRYTGKKVYEIQIDLLTNYATISNAFVDPGLWESEESSYLQTQPDALITTPTEVNKLVSELCEQWPHKLFWDDRNNVISFVPLKEPPLGDTPFNDEQNFVELAVTDKPEMQLSTIIVNYGQINPTRPIDEPENYEVTYVRVNTDAIARYDSNNTKVVNSRWISSSNSTGAKQLATLLGRRFGFTPRQIRFTLEDKDSALWLGYVFKASHRQLVDQLGYPEDVIFEVTSAQEGRDYVYEALEYQYDEELADDTSVTGADIVDVQGEHTDYNLLTEYQAIYGTATGSTNAKFIFYSSARVGSSSTSTAAVNTGSWPAGATVVIEVKAGGIIAGAGGAGSSSSGSAGGNGGDAISLAYDIEVINGGTIGGGGGGGGAEDSGQGHTAGGGGGAGLNGGAAGSSDFDGSGIEFTKRDASKGGELNGGTGARVQAYSPSSSASGGDGGGLGQSGTSKDSAGGSAGKAIDLNGNTATITQTGNLLGAVS